MYQQRHYSVKISWFIHICRTSFDYHCLCIYDITLTLVIIYLYCLLSYLDLLISFLVHKIFYKRRLLTRFRKQVKEGPDEDAVGVESTYTWSMPQFPPFHLFTPKTLSKLLTLTIPLIAIEMKRDSSVNIKLLG